MLYAFGQTSADGVLPAGLIQGSDGNFYGVTMQGGANTSGSYSQGAGTFFSLTPTGTKTTLYSFYANATDGAWPIGLLQANDGNFYGTTISGGSAVASSIGPQGTLYRATASGQETNLYTFGATNSDALGGDFLVLGANGSFYGVSSWATSQATTFTPAAFFVFGQTYATVGTD